MKKEKRVQKLKKEIDRVFEFIQNEIDSLFSGEPVEPIENYIDIAILGQFMVYFENRRKELKQFMDSPIVDDIPALEQIKGKKGNQFLLKYGADILCANINEIWWSIDSDEFRFEESYIEELIDLVEKKVRKRDDKLPFLNKEVEKVIGFIQNEQSKIFENGEIIKNHMYIALLGEMDNYFTSRWRNIMTFMSSSSNVDDTMLEEILTNKGNRFLLKHDAETLCENIWNTWLKIDSDEFRFKESYIEELIDLLEERITKGE